jgi:hypothetical protein
MSLTYHNHSTGRSSTIDFLRVFSDIVIVAAGISRKSSIETGPSLINIHKLTGYKSICAGIQLQSKFNNSTSRSLTKEITLEAPGPRTHTPTSASISLPMHQINELLYIYPYPHSTNSERQTGILCRIAWEAASGRSGTCEVDWPLAITIA